MHLLYAVTFFALIAAICAYVPQNERQFRRLEQSPSDLYKALFKNYNKNVRPVIKATDTITTYAGFSPLSIRELDEEKEILTMDSWLFLMWEDDFLTWEPEEYGGIKSLIVPSSEVWKPDITLYTASPDTSFLLQTLTNVIINYTGQILWVPPMTISSRCALELTQYPYDTQVCLIKYGSWTMGKSRLDIQLSSDHSDMKDFSDNNPYWSMTGMASERMDTHYPCCPNESYPSLNINVTLRRKLSAPVELSRSVSYYAGFLALLMFWLPADSSYKIILGAIAEALMGFAVFYVGAVLPSPLARLKAAEKIYPMMCAVSAALIVEALVISLARIMGPCRPPRCIVALAKGFCTPFCTCVSRSDSMDDLKAQLNHPEKLKNHLSATEEWNVVAVALDRILFILALAAALFFYKFW